MARTAKSENKTPIEKPKKALSYQAEVDLEHLSGKHTLGQSSMDSDPAQGMASNNPDCGFCKRRVTRIEKKQASTKRYYASHK